jgi:hypothetical protein
MWGRLVSCSRLEIGLVKDREIRNRPISNRPQDTILPHKRSYVIRSHGEVMVKKAVEKYQ